MTTPTRVESREYVSGSFPVMESPICNAVNSMGAKARAEAWEHERDACMSGDYGGCCSSGLSSRVKHVGGCGIESPIQIYRGLVHCFGCCTSSCNRSVTCIKDDKCTSAADCCSMSFLSLFQACLPPLHCLTTSLRLPFNIFCSEMCSGICYQHRCDLAFLEAENWSESKFNDIDRVMRENAGKREKSRPKSVELELDDIPATDAKTMGSTQVE